MRNDELYHYGVLGMHWGVYRAKRNAKAGRYGKSLERTNKMLRKYDRRMQRNVFKVRRNILSEHFQSNDYRARKYKKAKKYAEAATFVYNKMQTVYAKTTLDAFTNNEGVSYGQRYAEWLLYAND